MYLQNSTCSNTSKVFQSHWGKTLHQKSVRNELRDLCQYTEHGPDFYELLSTHCQKLCALELEKIQSNSVDLIVLLQIHHRSDLISVATVWKCNIRFSGVKIVPSSYLLSVSYTVLISLQILVFAHTAFLIKSKIVAKCSNVYTA